MVRFGAGVLLIGLVLTTGCDRQSTVQPEAGRAASDAVVSAGASTIDTEDIELLMREEGLSAKEAAERMAESLLFAEQAKRLNLAVGQGTAHIERLLVRRLLDDLEEETAPQSFSTEIVREMFDTFPEQFGGAAFETVEPAIRRRLSFEARQKAFHELVNRLETSIPIARDDKGIHRALSLSVEG